MTIDPVIATIVQYALAWLYLSAAVHKLRDISDFRGVITTYRVVPEVLVGAVAWLVVGIEAAIGFGVLFRQPIAFAGAAMVLFGYAAVIGLNLLRGRRFIDCGCGGAAQPLSVGLVVRNVVLAMAAVCALAPTTSRAIGWVDVVSMVAGVLVAGTLYAAANQLLAARARLEEWV
jgi:Methylamine utilisation protein MauE